MHFIGEMPDDFISEAVEVCKDFTENDAPEVCGSVVDMPIERAGRFQHSKTFFGARDEAFKIVEMCIGADVFEKFPLCAGIAFQPVGVCDMIVADAAAYVLLPIKLGGICVFCVVSVAPGEDVPGLHFICTEGRIGIEEVHAFTGHRFEDGEVIGAMEGVHGLMRMADCSSSSM